ncbi:MAG: iron-containing alcohol dehydrogenase [Candidatus Riflebacteria bacterium]|nr:iron-containing alcohol dehydrogenase [Candidatus Riflebacteria bacterium]
MRTDLYGSRFDCECGRTHSIVPELVVLADDAVDRLCQRALDRCPGEAAGRTVVVLDDARTRLAAGDRVAEALGAAGFTVFHEILEDREGGGDPVCDDLTFARLCERLPACRMMVAVGSGVVSDLVKWVAFERRVPYFAFATAASMNGYASANVAPTVSGVKTLQRAAPPVAVFSSLAVLADAPYRLTASGLGDIVAKPVSSADWRLNNLLFGDYFCGRSVGLIGEIEPLYLDDPAALASREARSLAALFEGLILTGVAMTMAESSAPSSGGEHLISHCLDMMSSVDRTAHDLHGRQVGVGTILASALYERMLQLEAPTFAVPHRVIDERLWGPLARNVALAWSRKRERLEAAPQHLGENDRWDSLRSELAPMVRRAGQVASCLKRAGAACRVADLGLSRERVLTAFVNAHTIRDRFTILDLAWLAGLMPGAAREIVEEWA